MTGKECMRILKKHGISRDEFAGMMGIKKSTMRTCVHGNRISRKMVERLKEMEGESVIAEEIAEVNALIEEARKPRVVVRRRARDAWHGYMASPRISFYD